MLKRRQVGIGEPIDYFNLPPRQEVIVRDYFDHVGITVKSVLEVAEHPNSEFASEAEAYGEANLSEEDQATLKFLREMRQRRKKGLAFLYKHPRVRYSTGIRQRR